MRLAKMMVAVAVATLVTLGATRQANAHCDRLDGPVVKDAHRALGTGVVTPVLKWISAEQEPAVKAAFRRALAARETPARRAAADRAFFATLVQLHRQSEGAPFTGLKPAGGPVHPAVAAADGALAGGDTKQLRGRLVAALERAVDQRFDRVKRLSPSADTSVARGREYVKAYVDYVHFIKHLHGVIGGESSHH